MEKVEAVGVKVITQENLFQTALQRLIHMASHHLTPRVTASLLLAETLEAQVWL